MASLCSQKGVVILRLLFVFLIIYHRKYLIISSYLNPNKVLTPNIYGAGVLIQLTIF